jgi:hypothetical protein
MASKKATKKLKKGKKVQPTKTLTTIPPDPCAKL